MVNPLNLSPHHPIRKAFGVLIVAALATVAALVLPVGSYRRETSAADWLIYDLLWRSRPYEDMRSGSVAIIGIGERDLAMMSRFREFGYPWPRQFWGHLVEYLAAAGVKAVVFDLQFSEPSVYNGKWDDDVDFAGSVDKAQAVMPVIFGVKIQRSSDKAGTSGPAPPQVETIKPDVKRPRLGVVTVEQGAMLRQYVPSALGQSGLARAALEAVNARLPPWADAPFLLRWYGPAETAEGSTFLYVSAFAHWTAAFEWMEAGAAGAPNPVDPRTRAELERLKGRVVLIGGTSAATYDLFSSPLSRLYPGVDMHATAIENLLRNDRTVRLSDSALLLAVIATALATAAVTIFPIGAWVRLGAGSAVLALLAGSGLALFLGDTVEWLPLAAPLLAGVLGIFGGFARNYLTEDARRRLMTKAMTQYVSPEVTRVLERKPDSLKLDAEQRTMTALFSDMAGFTDFSEAADIKVLTRVLNVYMERMSAIVLAEGGTIDKYIGDAVMAFWNAPLSQPDHAARACRAALRMRAAESAIRDELLADAQLVAMLARDPAVDKSVRAMGAGKLYTRFGVNTGPMNVGNWGSAKKFQYTVIGDAVNSAARLEPANKRYGTRILIAESTALQIRPAGGFGGTGAAPAFLLRRVDVTRVKGKTHAMAVYELMAEGEGTPDQRELAAAYEHAFGLYQQQRWDEVEKSVLAIRTRFGDDGPCQMLLERTAHLRQSPPGADWDGVFTATDK